MAHVCEDDGSAMTFASLTTPAAIVEPVQWQSAAPVVETAADGLLAECAAAPAAERLKPAA